MGPTNKTLESGVEDSLTHCKNMILEGIQAVGKKSVNWNEIKEINQIPRQNPSAWLVHLKECL